MTGPDDAVVQQWAHAVAGYPPQAPAAWPAPRRRDAVPGQDQSSRAEHPQRSQGTYEPAMRCAPTKAISPTTNITLEPAA